MKKTIFEGIVNGAKYDNVDDYNKAVQAALDAGVNIEASSSTRITEVADEACPCKKEGVSEDRLIKALQSINEGSQTYFDETMRHIEDALRRARSDQKTIESAKHISTAIEEQMRDLEEEWDDIEEDIDKLEKQLDDYYQQSEDVNNKLCRLDDFGYVLEKFLNSVEKTEKDSNKKALPSDLKGLWEEIFGDKIKFPEDNKAIKSAFKSLENCIDKLNNKF